MEDFSWGRVRGAVLGRQGLAGARLGGVAEAVRVVVGVFGSAPPCYLSLAARVGGFRIGDIDRELYESRSVVRVRAMHEMNFAVAAADLPVVLAATHAGGPKARAQLLKYAGIADAEYEELAEKVLAHLAGVPSASSAEIRAVLGEVPENFTRVIALMGRECRLVRAEVRGGWRSDAYAYAAWESWTGSPLAAHDPEAARVELARRYLAGFGPATAADLKWWAGWTVRDTKAALASLETVEISVEGAPMLLLAADLPALREAEPASGVRLLPYWDALMMGYALPNRAPRLVAPEHHARVYDKSGNGTSVVLVDGVVAGVWDFDHTPDALTVRHALFPETPPSVLPALEAEAALLAEATGASRLDVLAAPPPALLADAKARNVFMSPIRLASLPLAGEDGDHGGAGREAAGGGERVDAVQHLPGVDGVEGDAVACGEVGDEGVERRGAARVAAVVEAELQRPLLGGLAVFALEAAHLVGEEGRALEDGEAERVRAGPQAERQAREGAAGPDRAAQVVVGLGDLGGGLRAAPDGEGVRAAFRQHVEPTGRHGLVPVCRAGHVPELHALGRRVLEDGVERAVLLAPDDPHRAEAVTASGGGRRPDVVGVRAAERQERVVALGGGLGEVVLELPPLVARDVRVDEIVTFDQQPDAAEPLVLDGHERRRRRLRQEPGRDGHQDSSAAIAAAKESMSASVVS